jgi:hypothetical protein
LAASGLLAPFQVRADTGSWSITQLPFANAAHPSINNAGEVVWAVQNSTGIVSSVRGQLSASGVSPHLANSGEVVYADTFGGPGMDLVSTTRGRLTQGGIIELGFSDFGVNSNGEVVYCALTNGNWQVFSIVRGQVTFDAVDRYNPCINDLGEIIWNQYGAAPNLISSTRGPLPGYYPFVLGLNNLEEFCYDADLVSGNLSTSPHIFSSVHGVVINDIEQFQWGGGINDAGTMVWTAPANPSSPVWYVFEATWVPAPVLTVVQPPRSGAGLADQRRRLPRAIHHQPPIAGHLAAIQRHPGHQRGKLPPNHRTTCRQRGIFPPVNRQSLNRTIQLNHEWTRIPQCGTD